MRAGLSRKHPLCTPEGSKARRTWSDMIGVGGTAATPSSPDPETGNLRIRHAPSSDTI